MSQQLGFKRFELIRNVRKNFTPRHYRTGSVYTIEPWSQDQRMNKYEQIHTTVPEKNCQHLTQSSYYINADGKISICCYMNTQLSADNINNLPDIKEELGTQPRPICLHHCGN